MTGFIIFIIVEIRTDIIFATSITARFAHNPDYQYTKVVKTVMQYFKGSREQGITFRDLGKLLFEGYSDSDWTEDKKD